MYDPGPSDEELQAIGITREDVANNDVVEIWPENWLPYEVFLRMRSQWHQGMGGATGLVYSSLDAVMRRSKVSEEEYDDVFDAVQVMEYAALNDMAERNRAASKRS